MTDSLTKAVREAVEDAPASARALAEQADVAHSTLVRIIGGERKASIETARRVAKALADWSRRCDVGATRIERVIQTLEDQ